MEIQIGVQVAATDSGTATDFASAPEASATMSFAEVLTDGILADAANLFWADERTIASASNDDIDLAGVLASLLGETFAAAKLVGLIVINKPKATTADPNTTNLTIGAGTNPVVGYLGGTTPTIGPLTPGGVLLLMNPALAGLATVTAATGDILRIANSSGASATYQIGIIARAAA